MARIQHLALSLKKNNSAVPALWITHAPDVRYLTGFTGSSAALIVPIANPRQAILFTDGRYIQQAKEQTKNARVKIVEQSLIHAVGQWLEQQGIRRCGFDAEHTSVLALDAMQKAISGKLRRGFFVPLASPVARQRQVKDAEEVRAMQAAADLGCDLFEKILTTIVPGRKEVEIAAEMELAARMAGADGMSFETIVAAGARSALPHGKASSQRLPPRGFGGLECGVLLNGYCSDMTRTIHLGAATKAERFAFEAVLEAQMAGVEAVRPGVTCGQVDEAARSVLRRAKLAQHFTHSTGHGVGLEIHEGPRLAANQSQILEPGMVVTVEPGVYLPTRFGIRIEAMVVVTENGHRVLTRSPKAWIEL